ncbi:arylsulfatase [Portibacter marinus]|uniref:arylsulfatase n=1 Tax=Portibacter marinus TaxID=2898660 RepID=UPI001F2EF5D1|nr:arylsulfatase [Portibacter marinus]
MSNHFLPSTFHLIIFLFLGVVSCSDNTSTKNVYESEKKATPNIIYILADDLGYGDLSCYGQKKFSTPNIDRLAREGMKFTSHYSGSTVCAPSRSTLLTGQHTGFTYIRGNKEVRPEGQHPLPDSIFTMAEMFKEAGYKTGAFGKWGLGFPGSPGDPNNQGFDTFYGYNCQRLGHHYYPRHLWSDQQMVMLDENSGKEKESYAPDLIHQKTLQFIEDNKTNPFFLYVPSIIPHAELIAPDSIMGKYVGQFEPEKPYNGYDEGEKYRQGPYESQSYPHAAFVAMIEVLDRQVGEIVEKVKALGLEENTLIIFTSDNGPHVEGGADPDYFDSNGPLKGYKRDLYEGGIRVPMIVKWKGKIEPNTQTDHISAFWDVYPTMNDLLGMTPKHEMNGITFLPTILGKTEDQIEHEYLYWEFHEKGGRAAARKGKWKAVRYNVFESPNRKPELYNLETDIGETNNLADEYPEITKEMISIIDNARKPSEVFTFESL